MARARRLSSQPARYEPAAFGRRGTLAASAAAVQGYTVVVHGEPPASFVASAAWTRAVVGKVFKRGAFGVGYYDDVPVAAHGVATAGQLMGAPLSLGKASMSWCPCPQGCDCARCLPRNPILTGREGCPRVGGDRRARFAVEAARPLPPLPRHRITVIGGNVNKSDVAEKTLALAVRQFGGTDKSRKPRDVLSEGLLNTLSALGVDDSALDDYDALLALLHERQTVNRAALTRATTITETAARAGGAAVDAGARSRVFSSATSIPGVAALKRKVAAAVRTLGERAASDARSVATAAGGSEAGAAFDAAARERDAASAVASMVAAAVADREHARIAAAARSGQPRVTQAMIGLRV